MFYAAKNASPRDRAISVSAGAVRIRIRGAPPPGESAREPNEQAARGIEETAYPVHRRRLRKSQAEVSVCVMSGIEEEI
jgi:hypothetical protein